MRERILQRLRAGEVSCTQAVTELGADLVLGDERRQLLREPRTILADRPGDIAALADRDVVANDQSRQKASPGACLEAVDDGPRQQASTHHLQQILVPELPGCRHDDDGLEPFALPQLVELAQMLEVAAGFPDLNC